MQSKRRLRSHKVPFRNVVGVTALPNGKIAYLHPTKGWRNRRPTPLLFWGLLAAEQARKAA